MDLGKVFPNIGQTISTGSFRLPGGPVRKQVKDFDTVNVSTVQGTVFTGAVSPTSAVFCPKSL